ncbi:leucine-rich repeat domain-containing protein [Paenibacillus athensensis]|uniref:Copper amine oxidase-like N-terminal domain-containing protein n=1 Tax=Paenibacillus athensensis TaxID=1967502 RepID=A0A4Y8PTC3_9BACL|nr:stalk domain-containing protein [Paenibacillus athensensis]MCD1261745.1 leucine-rich repeat domain-containing protein [Paenibacillus athensensis]
MNKQITRSWTARSLLLLLAFVLLMNIWPSAIFAQSKLIADPTLETALREKLGKPSGELSPAELETVTSLYAYNQPERIASLKGLEFATGLGTLVLSGQAVSDIGPISGLHKLTFLAVDRNEITDLTPLTGLAKLTTLLISGNRLEHLDALEHLNHLTDLLAGNNQISDLSPLRNLPLKWLSLEHNQLTDISVLEEMPTLENVYVNDNHISDISALELLPRLQSVALDNNPLNDQAAGVIARLKQKGVRIVTTNPPPGEKPITVLFDANPLDLDQNPFIREGTTLVPFRAIFEKLGLDITWQQETQTIVGESPDTTIKLQIGSRNAEVNGAAIELPEAPELVDNSTFVPIRFVAEATGALVDWDAGRRQVIIKAKHALTSADGTAHVTVYGLWNDMYEGGGDATHKFGLRSFDFHLFFLLAAAKESPGAGSLNDYYETVKAQNVNSETDRLLSEENVSFKDYPARRFIFMDNQLDTEFTITVFETEHSFYQVVFGTEPEYRKAAQADFDGIVQSLTFEP